MNHRPVLGHGAELRVRERTILAKRAPERAPLARSPVLVERIAAPRPADRLPDADRRLSHLPELA